MRNTWAVFFLFLVVTVFFFSLNSASHSMTYSQLRMLITKQVQGQPDDGNEHIKNVVITNGDPVIQVQTTLSGDHYQNVTIPGETRQQLIADLNQKGIAINVIDEQKTHFWFSMISSFFLPILLLVGFLFMFRSSQAGTRTRPTILDNMDSRMSLVEGEVRELRSQMADMKAAIDAKDK